MSDILPGDTVRLTITGNDSSILVDSWNSAIRGPVVGSNGTTLVDTVSNLLLGKLEGELAGNVLSSNGSIVLNPGINGTDAVFIGDVTGDLVGEVFGDVTGNIIGDVLDENENIILDATNRTLTVNTITTENIVLSNDLTVNSLVAGEITTGNLIGSLLGDSVGMHTGEVFGDVTGNVTGDITGNVLDGDGIIVVDTGDDVAVFTGDLVGTVFGDVTGNLNGNVTGEVYGNVTGNVTGDLIGNLKGRVWNQDGTKIGLDVQEDGAVSIASNNNGTLVFGNNNDTLTITSNYRESNDFVVVPHPSAKASSRMHYHRLDDNGRASVNPGDILDFKSIIAYNGSDYKTAGHWGYAVDPEWTVTDTSQSIRTIFGISVADGTNQPDVLGPKKLSVNHEGIVGGYGFKANPISSTERNNLTATAGMIIFNSSTNKFQGYNGSSWVDLG